MASLLVFSICSIDAVLLAYSSRAHMHTRARDGENSWRRVWAKNEGWKKEGALCETGYEISSVQRSSYSVQIMDCNKWLMKNYDGLTECNLLFSRIFNTINSVLKSFSSNSFVQIIMDCVDVYLLFAHTPECKHTSLSISLLLSRVRAWESASV